MERHTSSRVKRKQKAVLKAGVADLQTKLREKTSEVARLQIQLNAKQTTNEGLTTEMRKMRETYADEISRRDDELAQLEVLGR